MPESDLKELTTFFGSVYEVDPDTLYEVIQCESGGDSSIQSKHRYPKDNSKWGVKAGDRERSFGLVQIHLPSHPDVSEDQAKNPRFAVKFLAKHFSEGRAKWWTCYKGQHIYNGRTSNKPRDPRSGSTLNTRNGRGNYWLGGLG